MMSRFQIWPQNLNPITYDALLGQKTVKDLYWVFCQFSSFFGSKRGSYVIRFKFETRFGILSSSSPAPSMRGWPLWIRVWFARVGGSGRWAGGLFFFRCGRFSGSGRGGQLCEVFLGTVNVWGWRGRVGVLPAGVAVSVGYVGLAAAADPPGCGRGR